MAYSLEVESRSTFFYRQLKWRNLYFRERFAANARQARLGQLQIARFLDTIFRNF